MLQVKDAGNDRASSSATTFSASQRETSSSIVGRGWHFVLESGQYCKVPLSVVSPCMPPASIKLHGGRLLSLVQRERITQMGAYLHLRGLAELGETSDSSTNTENLLQFSESACAANEVTPAGTPGSFTSISCTQERTDNTTVIQMDDCSNFWAGKLDDVFVDLNETGQEDFPKILKDRSVDRRERADSSSEKSGISRKAYVTDRILQDVRLVNHGVLDAGFQNSVTVASTSSSPLEGDKESTFTEGCTQRGRDDLGSTHSSRSVDESMEDHSERLPDHLLIELLVRVPTRDWPAAACVKKRWAQLFKGDGLWHSALMKKWPGATSTKRWPGPIARGSSKRRYTALYVSDSLFAKDKVEGVHEVAGHVYLFLKEQLESPTPPVSYGLLHGTIIDQFLACCKTGDEAHKLASHIWIAVLDNLDESENTFHLLMRIAEEWEVFPGYPYSKSHEVQWRLFERLFTDFRDCLSQYNYFDVLTRVRNKFEMIPQTWMGY